MYRTTRLLCNQLRPFHHLHSFPNFNTPSNNNNSNNNGNNNNPASITLSDSAFNNDLQSKLEVVWKEFKVGGSIDPQSVVTMMKSSRSRTQAESVLDLARKSNTASKPLFDSYLACLADLKLPNMVKDGLATMIESQITPDDKSYSALLKAHLETGSHFHEIEKLIDKLTKNGAMGDHGYFAVIRYYCRTGLLDIGMRFYHRMIRNHIVPSLSIYNELIQAHSRTPQGCKGMFDEMRKRGVEPSEDTYEILAKVYSHDASTCRGLHSGMEKRGIAMNAKIAANMITAFGTAKDWEWCKKVWTELLQADRKPKIETFLAMLTYYTASGDSETIMQVLNLLKDSNLVSLQFVYTSMISVLAQAGEYKKCVEIYSTMHKEGIKPSPEVYESLMIAYAKQKDSKTALSFERQLREQKSTPSRAAYHSLLSCMAHSSDARNVTRLIDLMKRERIEPSIETYLSLFEGAQGKAGTALVRRWVREMEEECNDSSSHPEAYISALKACARGQDAQGCLEIFEKLKLILSNTSGGAMDQVYDIVLSSCAVAGNLAVCKRILGESRKANASMERETYNKLLEGFAKLGDLPECRILAGEMKEKQMELDTRARSAIRLLSNSGSGGLFNTLMDEIEEVDDEARN